MKKYHNRDLQKNTRNELKQLAAEQKAEQARAELEQQSKRNLAELDKIESMLNGLHSEQREQLFRTAYEYESIDPAAVEDCLAQIAQLDQNYIANKKMINEGRAAIITGDSRAKTDDLIQRVFGIFMHGAYSQNKADKRSNMSEKQVRKIKENAIINRHLSEKRNKDCQDILKSYKGEVSPVGADSPAAIAYEQYKLRRQAAEIDD